MDNRQMDDPRMDDPRMDDPQRKKNPERASEALAMEWPELEPREPVAYPRYPLRPVQLRAAWVHEASEDEEREMEDEARV